MGLLVMGGGFLLVAALVALQGQHQTASAPETSGEAPKAAPEGTPVQVMKPQRRDMVHTLTLPANISPWYQATLFGKVSGYLKWVGVDKGDLVRKGQLLAVIEAPEIEDQYKQAVADYSIKKLTYERYLGVWNDNPNVIAKQDVDVAAAAAQGAKHLRDSRRTMLEYTRVTAPFAGIITARFADPGALIQAATGSATQAVPLFTIMDIETVRVYISVPQEEARLAQPGVPVQLAVKELPGHEFKSSVTRTTEALDPTTRTLLVETDLPNHDRLLHPGMFVSATLYLEQRPNALAIRPLAIVPGKSGQTKSVFVVEQGKAHLVPIKTGIDDGSWVEVTEGLTGNEDVVLVGKGNITEGQTLAASPYNLPAGTPARQKL
jgi:RND family efflux transporter MFP subunit